MYNWVVYRGKSIKDVILNRLAIYSVLEVENLVFYIFINSKMENQLKTHTTVEMYPLQVHYVNTHVVKFCIPDFSVW